MAQRPHLLTRVEDSSGYLFTPLDREIIFEPIYLPPSIVRRRPMLDWKPATEAEPGWIEFDGYWWASFPMAARLLKVNERNLHALANRWRFRIAVFPEGEAKSRKRGKGRRPERYLLVMDLEHYSTFRKAWNAIHGREISIISPAATRMPWVSTVLPSHTTAKDWERTP